MAASNSDAARSGAGSGSADRPHRVVTRRLARVALLGNLEIVQCVEERQQAQVGGSFQADQVRRVDDENTMEGESRRPRIDVSDASQEKSAQELTVGYAAPQLLDQHLGAPVPRRALDQVLPEVRPRDGT